MGLNDQDKLLFSRQEASTFDAAVKELLREEALQQTCVDSERPSVHGAECIAVDSTSDRSETPPRRSADRAQSPRRYRDVSPGVAREAEDVLPFFAVFFRFFRLPFFCRFFVVFCRFL